MTDSLRINGERLWQTLMEMAKIGALPAGGCGRLALTDADKQARDLLTRWCESIGCRCEVDELGNMFARLDGTDADALPVSLGSHLDTQPHGGKFDGVYGVLAGLEVLRTVKEAAVQTKHPLEVINWTNEEGARFAPAMLASGVYAGVFDLDFALSRRDADGVSVEDELRRIGYAGQTPCGQHKLAAFLEAHIEQGPVLEREDKVIGLVTGGQGQRWYDVGVFGQDAHSGSTPMEGRKDALVVAASLVSGLREIALRHAPHAVATVGEMHVQPNSRNTIPGKVSFSVDLRHPDNNRLKEMGEAFRRYAEDQREARVVIEEIWTSSAVRFDEGCINVLTQAIEKLGYTSRKMVSGAGHDACQIARTIPTAMVFVPCAGGISHNEAESAEPEHLEAGANVLLHAALSLADVNQPRPHSDSKKYE